MSKYRIKKCDCCGYSLDSNGCCHVESDCPNYCNEYPNADRDLYDEWRQSDNKMKPINPDSTFE